MSIDGKSRDELAQEADNVRSKLMRTVEELDRRRHDALDMGTQLERHVRQIAIMGSLFLVATTGAMAIIVHRATNAGRRRRRNRWLLARDLWHHPERAIRAERHGVLGQLSRSLVMTLAGGALAIPVRRAIVFLLDQRRATTPRGCTERTTVDR